MLSCFETLKCQLFRDMNSLPNGCKLLLIRGIYKVRMDGKTLKRTRCSKRDEWRRAHCTLTLRSFLTRPLTLHIAHTLQIKMLIGSFPRFQTSYTLPDLLQLVDSPRRARAAGRLAAASWEQSG